MRRGRLGANPGSSGGGVRWVMRESGRESAREPLLARPKTEATAAAAAEAPAAAAAEAPAAAAAEAPAAAAAAGAAAAPAAGPRPPLRYHPWLIRLHWASALVLALVYGSIEARKLFAAESVARRALKSVHFSLGAALLLLTAARLCLRLRTGRPPVRPAAAAGRPAALASYAALASHAALYALLLLTPLLGWLLLNLGGKRAPLVPGLFYLPRIATPGHPGLRAAVKRAHILVGRAGYFVVAAHTAAALYHHYAIHDNTLRRMMPPPARHLSAQKTASEMPLPLSCPTKTVRDARSVAARSAASGSTAS